MIKKIIQRNPLFFAFLLPAVTDGLTTLLGQNKNYWFGSKIINEASPAYYFLVVSPAAFVIGGILWFVFWYWLFKKIKEPVNIFLMFLFISGHSWGSSSWIIKMFKENSVYIIGNQVSIMFAWLMLIIYFGLIAMVATYCLKIYLKKK